MQQTPRTEFAQALKAVASARKLDSDVVLNTIKQAIIAAYKKDVYEEGKEIENLEFDVEIDPNSGETKIFSWPLNKPEDKKDITPPGFGRIAAQTAKQVIHQKIREAEREAIIDEFSNRVNTLISGVIIRFDGADVRIDLGRSEATMPASERIPNEKLSISQRLTFLIKEIRDGGFGKQIILSRADPMFVQKLFEREVPEMSAGSVIINRIAREPGVRTKICVMSAQSGIDPVGSCVGQKGVRVQAVTNELGGERIDIIQYTEDVSDLIKSAIAPATNVVVELDQEQKVAYIRVPENQLSLAIGKDGQNAKLVAKLSGWKIKIRSEDESLQESGLDTGLDKSLEKSQVFDAGVDSKSQAKNEDVSADTKPIVSQDDNSQI